MSIKIESIKNKTGVVVTHSESADNATHATNADQATRALAVPATGIEGLTVSGDIKKTTENDTVNLSVDVPIFVGDFTTSFAEWKAAFDAGKRLEFKNIVSTDIVIPADQIPDNGEDDENIYHEDDPEIDETEENEEEEEPEDYTETLTFNDIKLFYEKWEEYQEEDGPKAPVEDEPTYKESIVVTMANEVMYLAFYLDENNIWTVYLVGTIGHWSDNTIEIRNYSDYPYYYDYYNGGLAHDDEPEIDEEDEEEPYIPYYHPGVLFVGHLDNDWKKIMEMFEEWWGYEYEEPHPFSYVTSEEAYIAFDGGLNFILQGNNFLPSYIKVFYAEFNGVVTMSQPSPDIFVCYDYQNKKIWYVELSHYDDEGFLSAHKQEIEVGSSGGADGIFIGYMNTSYQEWREAYDYQNKVCYLYLAYNENGDSPFLLPMTWKQLSFTGGYGPTFVTSDDSFAYYKVYIEVDSDSRYNCGVFQTYNGEIVFAYDENPDLLNPKVYPFFTYYGWDYYNERNCETNSTEFLEGFEEKFKPKLLVKDTTKYPYEYKLYDYVSDKWSDYEEEHDCPVCNGTGQIEGQTCKFCGGTGKVNWDYYTHRFTFQLITDKIEKYEVIEEYLPYKPIYDEETETWDWGCEDYYAAEYEINKLPDEGFGTSNVFIGDTSTTYNEWLTAIGEGKLVKFNALDYAYQMLKQENPSLTYEDFLESSNDGLTSELINDTKITYLKHENILDENSPSCVSIEFCIGTKNFEYKGIMDFHLMEDGTINLWSVGMLLDDKIPFQPNFLDYGDPVWLYTVDVLNACDNDVESLIQSMMVKPSGMTDAAYKMMKAYSLILGHMDYDLLWTDSDGDYWPVVDISAGAKFEDGGAVFYGTNIKSGETAIITLVFVPVAGYSSVDFQFVFTKSTEKWTKGLLEQDTNIDYAEDTVTVVLEHKTYKTMTLNNSLLILSNENFANENEAFECKLCVDVENSTDCTLTTDYIAKIIGSNTLETNKKYLISIFEDIVKIEEFKQEIPNNTLIVRTVSGTPILGNLRSKTTVKKLDDLPNGNEEYMVTFKNSLFNTSADLQNVFSNSNIVSIESGHLHTKEGTTFSNFCSNCSALSSVNFGIDRTKSFFNTFGGCSALQSINITGLDNNIQDPINLSYIAENCSSLSSFHIDNIESANVTGVSGSFTNCVSLTSGPQINLSNVTGDLYRTFGGCKMLKTIPNYDISNATSAFDTFGSCHSLTSIPPFNFRKMKSLNATFHYCSSLSSIPEFIETSALEEIDAAFLRCSNVTSIALFDTSNVTSLRMAFEGCSSLTSIPLFDTSNVQIWYNTFTDCSNLKTIPEFETSAATNMDSTFSYCTSLSSIPLINTHNVTITNSMFASCKSLSSVPLLDLSNVMSADSMFNYCRNLKSIPEFNLQNIKRAGYMFSNCSNLTSVAPIDFGNATYLNGLFDSCTSISSLPTINVSSTSAIRNLCRHDWKLRSIPKLINTNNIVDITNAFFSVGSINTVGSTAWMDLYTDTTFPNVISADCAFGHCWYATAGIMDMYSKISGATQHSGTFYQCGASSNVGSAETNQLPSAWRTSADPSAW